MEFDEEGGDYEELKVVNIEVPQNQESLRDGLIKSKKQGGMNDPELLEELEEFFHSAHDHFVSTMP